MRASTKSRISSSQPELSARATIGAGDEQSRGRVPVVGAVGGGGLVQLGEDRRPGRSAALFLGLPGAVLANEGPFVIVKPVGLQRRSGGVLGRLEDRVAVGRKVW
jgi:hypothetical protein